MPNESGQPIITTAHLQEYRTLSLENSYTVWIRSFAE